eukprot:g77338.t1
MCGAKAIGKALEVNKSITTLNLNFNKIGPDGAAAIGKALENNTTLTELDGIENKKALRIVETNRSRVTELQELCSGGAARVGVVGPVDNAVLFEKGTNLHELVLQSSKIAHHSSFQDLLVWISAWMQEFKYVNIANLGAAAVATRKLKAKTNTADAAAVSNGGQFKVGKSTLLERGWLARKTAKWSRLERTTSVLLFNCLDSEAGLHWMVRDLPGQPEFYATNLHFLSADCAVFLLLAPRLSSEFKHAHLDASGMLVDCETEKAPAMLEDLRKRVSRAGRNLLSIPDLANVPEFLVMAQDGLAKWRNKHLTKWHASYAEALEILVLRELIYEGDVMEFGTELVLSPVWLALALAVIVRPHKHPFYGLKTNRGGVSRQDIQKALLEERWPASMIRTKACQGRRRCSGCNRDTLACTNLRICIYIELNVIISAVSFYLSFASPHMKVLRFLQMLDVIVPLSHKHESLSAAAPAPEPTEDSQAAATQPLPLFRQPSTDISSAEKIMIPSSVGERYSGAIFAPRDLGLGFGERCLAAGVRKTTELLFPPGFTAVLPPRLLSKKLGPERLAIYFGTHEFCFREVDQPHPGDKEAVRVVLDEQGRELFLCVAGSKGFLFHYASSFVREVLTVLRLPRWGRAEESACVAHLLCQNCVLKGRGPARDTSQAGDEICEVLDEQPWATGREGLSVLWGLSRHDDVRGQQAKAGKMGKPCWLDVEMEKRDEKAMEKGKLVVVVVRTRDFS